MIIKFYERRLIKYLIVNTIVNASHTNTEESF